MQHTVLAVVVELLPQSAKLCTERVKALSASETPTPSATPHYPRSSKIDTAHFMSISIFDDPHYDELLVFENNFDGDRMQHWRNVVGVFGNELRQIFVCSKASQDKRYAAAFAPSGPTQPSFDFLTNTS